MLAQIEWQQVSSFGQWVFSGLLTVALFYIGAKTKRIETLEAEVKKSAGEQIDLKIGNVAAELRATLRVLENVLENVQSRLEAGDQHFKSVDQKNHALELKVMTQVTELYRGLATRDDMKAIADAMNTFQQRITSLESRLTRNINQPSQN